MKSAKRMRWCMPLVVIVLVTQLAPLGVANAEGAVDGDPISSSVVSPSVVSDKDDYVAGETVTLSGANWQPGESVSLVVNDDEGETWRHDATVDADLAGAFTYAFSLPQWFVATYSAVATGSVSGTATTTFTDSLADYVAGTSATGCTNPTNVFATDNVRAACTSLASPKTPSIIEVSGFGLDSIVPPTATGIAFNVEIEANDGLANRSVNVALSHNGGANYTATAPPTTSFNSITDVTRTVPTGGPTICSTFDRNWQHSELANFRVRVTHPAGAATVNIDRIRVRACWNELEIIQATVNNGSTTPVAPLSSVAASVQVEHRNGTGGQPWRCTRYQIEGQASVVNDHTDFPVPGLNTLAFPVTAPATPGVYDISFNAYNNNTCTSPVGSNTFTLTDAITVKLDPNFAFDLSSLPQKTYGDANFSVAGYASRDGDGVITFALATGSVGCTVTAGGDVTITRAAVGTDKCRIAATLAEGTNHQAAGPITQSFNIAKKTLTVTPSPQNPSRQYSDGNPSISPSYSGFVPGDDATDLDDPPPTCEIAATATATAPTGTYPITCSGGLDDNYAFSYVPGTLTITKEDATVTPYSSNPAALQVSAPGGTLPANALTLKFDVEEKEPDLGASPAAGDINNAGLTVKLTPLSTGSNYTLTCTSTVSGTGYNGVKTFTCKNPTTMAVNTYEVEAALACVSSGCYYGGTGWDAFTVYDPSLGFATGGGYVMRPTKNGPDEKMNFGFTMKYNSKGTSLQGNFIAIRHHANGTVSRLKSNSLGGLVIKQVGGCGVATFNGKSTYTTWDPTANGGLGDYVTTGNNSFSIYGEDCNNPGTGLDYLWLFGPGVMNMSTPAGTVSTDKLALAGGNISVPHR